MEPAPTLKPVTPQEDLIPVSYIIIKKQQVCACCFTSHSFSELYFKALHKSRFGLGGRVSVMTRITTPPRWNLPIETLSQRTEILPFCHSCYCPSLPDLPTPPTPEPVARTPLRLVEPEKASEASRLSDAPKSRRKPAPTLDDLFQEFS